MSTDVRVDEHCKLDDDFRQIGFSGPDRTTLWGRCQLKIFSEKRRALLRGDRLEARCRLDKQ